MVRIHTVRVVPSAARLPRQEQLAWKIAEFAVGRPPIEQAAANMVSCRLVDNAAVAIAAINRQPVVVARAQALAHPRKESATLFGLPAAVTVHAEWAAWANATAVRELDFHDTFLAADYAHPGDSIAPLIAVAQQCHRDGGALLRAILIAYEVHVQLVKAMCLHKRKKDHVAHLAPATVAGVGALLDLPVETVFQAVNQAVHLAFSTRQSRKGEISSWKAFVPGFSGKLAIEAIDRAMRGEAAPSPIYEGEDSVIAWMLDGSDAEYAVSLPEPGEAPAGILETYTKAHSAEYQAQAAIDLAIGARDQIDPADVREIVFHTSNHTHMVIGSGSNDPQKMDPNASRETLDHSLPYIMAVALEDGSWHHVDSYTRERAGRDSTVALWQRIRTVEDPEWTRRYHAADPSERAFGGRLEVTLQDGSVVSAEKAVADAHPNGEAPWEWANYAGKFEALTASCVDAGEQQRFLAFADNLAELSPRDICALNPVLSPDATVEESLGMGLFDFLSA